MARLTPCKDVSILAVMEILPNYVLIRPEPRSDPSFQPSAF